MYDLGYPWLCIEVSLLPTVCNTSISTVYHIVRLIGPQVTRSDPSTSGTLGLSPMVYGTRVPLPPTRSLSLAIRSLLPTGARPLGSGRTARADH